MMRHTIAAGLYSLAKRIDRPVVKWDRSTLMGKPWADIGDADSHDLNRSDITNSSFSLHTDDTTPVSASFSPGEFTYSALHIGRGVSTTVFLTRRSTRKLIDVLTALEARFCETGSWR